MTTDRFHLVRPGQRPPRDEARRALDERQVTWRITSHQDSAQHYQVDPDLATAVNMALAVGEPLLVTGGPGTGKTQLAYFLGDYFHVKVRAFHVKSTSTARDLKWDFDAVGYLQSAYAAREGGETRSRSDFLTPGRLWEAYDDPEPSVLLIDEIDKAPRDFPNDLLHELDQAWFPHPFDHDESGEPLRVAPKNHNPPVVVITSNVERQLPAPFLRRCIYHHIALTEELVRTAVAARGGEFPHLSPEIRQLALDRFWEIRDLDLHKPPATGELLVWLAILNARRITRSELEVNLAELPGRGALVKDPEDVKRL